MGVAYGAQVSGIRMLDGTVTDILEGKSFIHKAHTNWIFSCRWGWGCVGGGEGRGVCTCVHVCASVCTDYMGCSHMETSTAGVRMTKARLWRDQDL